MPYFVYIMASRRNGTLYTGVTNDLARRVAEHRDGRGSDFARRHGVTLRVWSEAYGDVVEAIAAEKRIKRWHRRWKLELIEKSNPDWEDLSSQLHRETDHLSAVALVRAVAGWVPGLRACGPSPGMTPARAEVRMRG